MNRKLLVNQDVFSEVLATLGYCECVRARSSRRGTAVTERQWRRQCYHLIMRSRSERSVVLTLHRDAHVSYPPGHKAVFRGKAVEEEFNKILSSYQALMRRSKPYCRT